MHRVPPRGIAGVVGIVRARARAGRSGPSRRAATGRSRYARPPNVHYFAPAFVFAALALLWLLQREPRARMPLLVWLIVSVVVWPAWDNREPRPSRSASRVQRGSAKQYVDANLRAGRGRARAVVLAVRGLAILRARADLRRAHTPDVSVPYLPATTAVRPFASSRGSCARASTSARSRSDLTVATQVELGDLGTYYLSPAGAGARRRDRQGPRRDRAVVSTDRYARGAPAGRG